MLAANVWHFWIAVFLVIPALLLPLALVVGYLVRVTRLRYPKG